MSLCLLRVETLPWRSPDSHRLMNEATLMVSKAAAEAFNHTAL